VEEERETIISFTREDPCATIYTSFPYIAKQLEKHPNAELTEVNHDATSNVPDGWSFNVPLTWFFKDGRLRIPREL